MLRLLLIFTFLSVFISFTSERSFSLFNLPRCFEVSFIQIGSFEGERDTYSGILISNGTQKRLIYLTNPPFEVYFDGTYLKMGYKGQDFQTFRADEYPNPILGILLHLNNLKKVFNLKKCFSDYCVLKPKPPINEYLKEVKVFFKNGIIKDIVANGGNYGKVEILITVWKDCTK